MSLSAGTRLGSYEILALIGVGGMGEVYRARDLRLGRTVAVKVLPDPVIADADRLARLDSEAKALASLNHPHIATLFGTDDSGGRSFIVMELVEGETLAERLERRGPLTVAETLRLALQIVSALEAAHANGVIHRDLKPANIKVRPDDVVKVLDFGLAKRIAVPFADGGDEVTRAELVTAPGTVVGTVAYMAPEVLRGSPASVRSDVFSLGVILFELLTGVHPFAGRSIFDVSARVLDPAVPDWPAVPMAPQARAVIARAMAKHPDQRYQSFADMRRDLETLAQSHSPPAFTSGPESQDRAGAAASSARSHPRRRLIWAALVLLALGAAVAVGQIIGVRRATPTQALSHKQVTFSGNVRGAALAPDGKTIAYTTVEDGFRRVLVQDVGGGRSVEIWKGELVVEVQWMRDGSQVLISGIVDNKTAVWLVPRLGGPGRRLQARGAHLAVSPDGRELASAFQNNTGFQITAVDGEPNRRNVSLPGFRWNYGLDWGAVSNRIAILAGLDDGTFAILTTAPDGSGVRTVYRDKALASVRWSPRENAVYAIRSREGVADIIRVTDTEGATPEVVASGLPWEPADPYQRQSSLSTDGDRLVVVRAFAYANLWRTKTDGSASPVAVTSGTSRYESPRLSPDGEWMVVAMGTVEQSPIVKVPIGGGEPVPIASTTVIGSTAAWSPDGQHVAVLSEVDGTPRVLLVDAKAGTHQTLPGTASRGALEWISNDRLMWHTPDLHDFVIHHVPTGTDERLTNDASGFVGDARVAPDGGAIAVWWNRAGDAEDGLWIVRWPSRQRHFVVAGDWYPAGWSADGAFIFAYEYLGNKLIKISTADRSVYQLATLTAGRIDGCDASRQGDVVCTVRQIHSDAWIIDNAGAPRPR